MSLFTRRHLQIDLISHNGSPADDDTCYNFQFLLYPRINEWGKGRIFSKLFITPSTEKDLPVRAKPLAEAELPEEHPITKRSLESRTVADTERLTPK
jgi:hypothetical protein